MGSRILAVVGLLAWAVDAVPDPLWLRYDTVIANAGDYAHVTSVAVVADARTCAADAAALTGAAAELSAGLSGLLGRFVPHGDVCADGAPPPGALVVAVGGADASDRGAEGYALLPARIAAKTASGALYGAFRYLSYAQRGLPPPADVASRPKMALRAWNLWDRTSGDVERGNAGRSLVWPYALYEDGKPPPKELLYVATACDATDPFQRWTGATLGGGGAPSTVKNEGAGTCVSTMACDPARAAACSGPESAEWVLRADGALQVAGNGSTADGACGKKNVCFDLNGGAYGTLGPDIDLWPCHETTSPDFAHQRFSYDASTKALSPIREDGEKTCLSLTRSAPLPDATANGEDDPWASGAYKTRVSSMLRLLKSSGINTLVLNDVNACGKDTDLLTEAANWTQNLGPLLDRYAITPMLAVCFGAPTEVANVSSDPFAPEAIKWWTETLGAIYEAYPKFGGVVVKADSEGNVGPASFNRTEADGANMLARILAPRGGRVLWRAFVYGNGLGADPNTKIGGEDLARQAYDTFKPLDGSFDKNVVLQIKSGPMDFQVREPLHPLLSGMPKSNVLMEVSANQGYTGHQIMVVNFAQQWRTYLDWDTMSGPGGSARSVASVLTAVAEGGHAAWGGGLACVSNLGNFNNMTAHVLAAANTYACGRLAWDPELPAGAVDREWAAMTFPSNATSSPVVDAVVGILGVSWRVFEGVTSPMGIGFITGQNNTYGCAPKTNMSAGGGEGPAGATCPPDIDKNNHYWMNPCDNYDFSNYSKTGLGCDRTSAGTGSRMIDTYSDGVKALLDDPSTVPDDLALFFHNLKWTDLVPPYAPYADGDEKVPLFDRIRDRHDGALKELAGMASTWDALGPHMVGDDRFAGVQARFAQHINDAAVFRTTVIDYYEELSGLH